MSTIITYTGGTITPAVVEGFEASRPARTIVHTILGRPDPDITFRPAGLQRGTLTLVFPNGAQARAAEAALVVPRVFTLTDIDVPEVAMQFVVADGDVTTRLDLETQQAWIVQVPFQEVAP
ncbi:hypothetical protein [Microbacterium sp. XT11]|uniref:hypothetical protein n=1 Tax=Microbacterium sp. XT11 TaxID=367477 RepID=UPI000829A1AD|nr:hypothetical protein [Microbacterium sp. XT11]